MRLKKRWRTVLAGALAMSLGMPLFSYAQAESSAARREPDHRASTGDDVRAEMAAHLQAEGLTGAVWTLVSPDNGVRTGAAGLQEIAGAKPMRQDTRVQVGSVAKTVLAIGVLRLVSTGRLSLDTELASLLPALQLDNPWQATHPVRIRHLLEHTAGLDNFRLFQVFSLRARADTPLSEGLGRIASPLVVRSRPGARHAYSNTGYHLLGMVIETVTGERFERYLGRELLQPLGMHDSAFAFTTQIGPGADPRLAMGYFEDGVAQPAIPVFLRPAMQFTTTASDMGRFAQFLMGSGEIGGVPFIAPEWMAELSGARDTDAARAGLSAGHGLALATRDRHGAVGDCHPGTTIGFRAMFCIYPRQHKAFFVAINADVETANYERLSRTLIDALRLAQPHRAPASSGGPPDMGKWEGIYVPTWNAVASLAWVDTSFSFAQLRRAGARITFKPFQGKPAQLRPAGGMLLQAGDRSLPSHVLLATEDGGRILSDGLRSYRKMPLAQMLWLWTSAALGSMGLLYVLLKGSYLLARGRLRRQGVLALPLAATWLLLLPLPFFFTQPFLALGDLTVASGLLALASIALPLAMACGLVRLLARAKAVRQSALDCAALLAVTQWTLVLLVWGVLPVILWQ